MRFRLCASFLVTTLTVLAASSCQPAEAGPGPAPEIATVTVHRYGKTHALDLVPGEWLEGIVSCVYGRGTHLRFEQQGCRLFLSVDGGPRRLAQVDFGHSADDKPRAMDALRQAIADGVSPLTICCEGKDLAALPAVPAKIQVALSVAPGPLGHLEGFIARCGAIRWLSLSGAPTAEALRAAKGISSLSISGLENLAPLAEMTKLRALSLRNHSRKLDLRPLAGLTELRSLRLGGWPVQPSTDLMPLRGLTKLRKLDLYDPPGDLGALAGMTELAVLRVEVAPQASNIEPLGSLNSLRRLTLWFGEKNDVKDLSPLGRLTRLQHLSLRGPAKPDLRFLGDLEELRALELSGHDDLPSIPGGAKLEKLRSLSIQDCKASSDLTPLRGLTSLRELELYGGEPAADVGPLAGMTELVALRLWVGTEARDIGGLGNLTNLKRLTLHFERGSKLTDLSPLGRLTKLQELELDGPAKSDLRFLAHLEELRTLKLLGHDDLSSIPQHAKLGKLRSLWVWGGVSDLTALAALNAIEDLTFYKCEQITDISPLAHLRDLRRLQLECCTQVSDLAPLGTLANLVHLSVIEARRVPDLKALANLKSLKSLIIQYLLELSDLRPLASLTSLESLVLTDCPKVTDLTPLASLPKLREVYVKRCWKVRDLSPLRAVLKRGGAIEVGDHDHWLWPQLERLQAEHVGKHKRNADRQRR